MTSQNDDVARTIEHACASIGAAAESRDPFLHIRFADLFPADLYARMLEAMPAQENYRRMSGRAKASPSLDVRTKIDLFPEWIRHLGPQKRPVWKTVGKALTSAPVRDAFVRRLAPGLERRFGAAHTAVGMYPVPILTRDVPGYRISIHADARSKGITVQIYLPQDRSIEHVGTVFHERDGQGVYHKTSQVPFLPNSGYAFAVGSDTHHSVDLVGPEVRTRDSILLTYFLDQTFVQVLRNRSRRFGNLLVAEARGIARRGAA